MCKSALVHKLLKTHQNYISQNPSTKRNLCLLHSLQHFLRTGSPTMAVVTVGDKSIPKFSELWVMLGKFDLCILRYLIIQDSPPTYVNSWFSRIIPALVAAEQNQRQRTFAAPRWAIREKMVQVPHSPLSSPLSTLTYFPLSAKVYFTREIRELIHR